MNKNHVQNVIQQQRRREWVGDHEVVFISNAEARGVKTRTISEITAAAAENAIAQRQSKER